MDLKPQRIQRTRCQNWERLLLFLALPVSLCCCMLLFVQSALSEETHQWLSVSMTTSLRADYSPDDWVETLRFAPFQPEVIDETTEEVGGEENSSRPLFEPTETRADGPQFVPVYEWPSD